MDTIFLHGLGQDSSSWDKTISSLTESIHTVCPNYLQILNNKNVTYENLYNAFCEFCQSLSTPLNLCGLSLGGVLALNYAVDHPKKVQSLVLIGAQYKMPINLLKFQNILFRFMPETSFKNMGFKKRDFIQLTNSMTQLNFTNNLKNISCPTLVLCGEKDSANKKASIDLANNISNAKLHLIPNVSHEINVEDSKGLALELNNFYKELLLSVHKD